ncbi:uncharacterized protein LOC119724536 isoform X1 [Patiria miniata]|uniref:Tyr recombinase domain-containing protein n=1 Tax=Patiria miniata TaxID=46514 RepID=A0A913ZIE3_PATMI|nr:uncharacterized protein LOC119724536 isoform X1 [Patiria miniata]XP_038051564.1 uncharacterized protein LOC119724536 isoform X1 [Patiria miniata]
MPFVRENLQRQGISQDAADIIIASWRPATKKSYRSAIQKWILFCARGQINPVRAPVTVVLDCLTEEFHKGNSYSSVNTLRSAISAIVAPIDVSPIGSHPLVKRFMTGVFNLRPAMPRYNFTWDVNIVFKYLKELGPGEKLPLKGLTMKLVMLIALISGQRCQTLSLLDLDQVNVTRSNVTFVVTKLTKTSRVGSKPISVVLSEYPHDEHLCVMKTLREYLIKTRTFRGRERSLFLSYTSPHKRVGSETISRWIKMTLQDAGIDIGRFKAHSTRSAACSAALQRGVPLDVIMTTAQWARSSTFAKFYNKTIVPASQKFADAVLSCEAK